MTTSQNVGLPVAPARDGKAFALPRGDTVWKEYVDAWIGQQQEHSVFNRTLSLWLERLAPNKANLCHGGDAAVVTYI